MSMETLGETSTAVKNWSGELEKVVTRMVAIEQTFMAMARLRTPTEGIDSAFFEGMSLALGDISSLVAAVVEETSAYAERQRGN